MKKTFALIFLMNGVQFTFRDNDHFTATWTNIAGGKSMAVPFVFTRVR